MGCLRARRSFAFVELNLVSPPWTGRFLSNHTTAADKVGLIAVIVSLLYVGREIKRNKDLAVVESQ